jgi:quercetin dioxygenase-like cupin family protein
MGDHCNCPHWGYVFKGRITFRFPDHDEVIEAGDACYVPAGHIPIAEAGTEYLQFSPADELHRTSEAIQRNMAAMQGEAPTS